MLRYWNRFDIITARIPRMGKGMFSQASVHSHRGGGGEGDWGTPPHSRSDPRTGGGYPLIQVRSQDRGGIPTGTP